MLPGLDRATVATVIAPRPSRLQSIVTAGRRAYRFAVTVLGTALMTVIVITMGCQVFFRYVLNDSLIWAEELSSYMLVLMSFLLLGAAFQRGEMARLELLVKLLPRRLRGLVMVPLYLLMIWFLVLLSYYGYEFALLNRTSTIPAIDFIVSSLTGETRTVFISRFWLYLVIPVGLLILSLHFLLAAVQECVVVLGLESVPEGSAATDVERVGNEA